MRDRHYQIAAVDDATSAYSNGGNKDLATTILFTDDPLTPLVRAVHFTELRTAVNAARVAVGIPTVTFTDSIVPGVVVKVIHLEELRTFLDEARSVIGSSPVSYTNPILGGTAQRHEVKSSGSPVDGAVGDERQPGGFHLERIDEAALLGGEPTVELCAAESGHVLGEWVHEQREAPPLNGHIRFRPRPRRLSLQVLVVEQPHPNERARARFSYSHLQLGEPNS